jgi:hypothetical protein
MSGHFFAASAAKTSELSIEGKVKWFQSSPEAKRGFCSDCGTPLFWQMEGEDFTSILAGAFDEGTKLVSKKHIFVEGKADYYEIDDGLPQYIGNTERVK